MQRFKQIFAVFTKEERVAFLVSSIVSVISFAVVIGIFISKSTTLVPAAGGNFSEGMVGQPEYVNPVTAQSETDLSLIKMIYSNIYDIANTVDVSDDGRIWTVRLKEGLRWHDGEKLTSDDIVFTVHSIEDEDAGSPMYQSWQGVAVNRASELEVQFSLANPYAFFRDNLKNLYILPKHLFANAPPSNWHLSDYNLKPIGSGPYEFVSYEKQSDGAISAYHLRAWNDYFGTKPLVSRFNFKFFRNTSDMLKSFNIGQIDGMSVGADDVQKIERPYDIFAWKTPSYYAVFFNQSKNLPLQDPAVRQALSAAVDRNSLIRNILNGHGTPEYGPIPDGAPYFVPTQSTSSLDFAISLLENAGWKTGDGGSRAKMIQKTAVPLSINLTAPQVDFLAKTAQALADTWEKLGARVTISTGDPQGLVNGPIKNRSYEALLFGNILGASSDLYAFWDSSQRFSPGLNLAIYSDKKVDSLIEGARMDMNDSSRATSFAKAETMIASDFPAVFLYSPDYLYVTDKSVRGVEAGFIPSTSDIFRTVGNWYLNTARVLK